MLVSSRVLMTIIDILWTVEWPRGLPVERELTEENVQSLNEDQLLEEEKSKPSSQSLHPALPARSLLPMIFSVQVPKSEQEKLVWS